MKGYVHEQSLILTYLIHFYLNLLFDQAMTQTLTYSLWNKHDYQKQFKALHVLRESLLHSLGSLD
jgi:hypothetical protein